jgi:hypothetical protein
MKFALDDYIDDYIRKAKYTTNKKISRHLKEIIPQTTHLHRETFKEIIEELKMKMYNGENFKNAFQKVCKKFILTGDTIKAELPFILTRVIVNIRLFVDYLSSRLGMDLEDIEDRIDSNDTNQFLRLIADLELAPPRNNVVFSTFDEDNPDNDPFVNHKVKDIINRIGKDRSSFKKLEPLSVIKIRYRNKNSIEKKFPIFPDAGWHDKFYPSKKDDKYGRTKSLDPQLKDLPEIVHENLTFDEVTEELELLEE